MIDIQNSAYCPTLEEICEYVRNPVLKEFCTEIESAYRTSEKIEFSKCSMKPGWNIKYKKSGKSLCTIYPAESHFTVLVVVGQKERERAELLLTDCCARMREIYQQTEEGNSQRWLMIDLEDKDTLYDDVQRFIAVRACK